MNKREKKHGLKRKMISKNSTVEILKYQMHNAVYGSEMPTFLEYSSEKWKQEFAAWRRIRLRKCTENTKCGKCGWQLLVQMWMFKIIYVCLFMLAHKFIKPSDYKNSNDNRVQRLRCKTSWMCFASELELELLARVHTNRRIIIWRVWLHVFSV